MSAHEHAAAFSRKGTPRAVYHFCVCGFVRIDWTSGRAIDWHQPSAEKAAEASRVDDEERAMERADRRPRAGASKFNHSPGPWWIDVDRIVDRDGLFVAAVADNGVVWGCALEDPKSMANAHVIVAAPDMRAALEEACALMPLGTAKRAAWMERANRALSRARVGG